MPDLMKIIFLPFAKDNPYQEDLAASLRKSNVTVISDIGFSDFSLTLSLVKTIIRNWKPAILHIHWLDPYMYDNSWYICILKSIIFVTEILIIKLLGIRIIWTVHNLRMHDGKYVNLEHALISCFIRICDGIIVHTASAFEKVKTKYGVSPDLIAVIPHGNYIARYKNDISRADARKHLDINESDHAFLYFGKIRPYKGVENLIETFNQLDQKNMKLIIAGKAVKYIARKPVKYDIAQDINNRCRGNKNILPVTSFIPADEIQIYMNAADVVVLPYKKIFTSGTVLLAMSFGKAIIAPAAGSIPDLLDVDGSFLYDPRDPSGLKKAMEKSVSHDLEKMGRYNYEKAKSYDWQSIADMTYSFYMDRSRQ